MNMETRGRIVIPNATSKKIIDLLKMLSSGSKTKEQIKRGFGTKTIPYNTINATKILGFVLENADGKFSIKEEFLYITEYSYKHPATIRMFKEQLLKWNVFCKLIHLLKINGGEMQKEKLGNQLEMELNAKWKSSSRTQYIEILINWGKYSKILKIEQDIIKLFPEFIREEIKLYIPEDIGIDQIMEKNIYDTLCELNLEEIRKKLANLEKELQLNSNNRGTKFQEIIAFCFKFLGFSVRTQDGLKEKNTGLSYQPDSGGGDIGLYIHIPISTTLKIYRGVAIACEVKATEKGAPKKALDQVRTFSEQIKRFYSDYKLYKLVISNSIGYEPLYARNKASPDVVHIQYTTLKNIIELQFENFNNNKKLLSGIDLVRFLDVSINEGKLETTWEYFEEKILKKFYEGVII